MSEFMRLNPERKNTWKQFLITLLVCMIGLFVFFASTFYSMIDIWWRSETFAHGFLIFPISLWLIWRNQDVLSSLTPKLFPIASLMLIPMGIVWLLADFVDVLVVQQLAAVSMMIIVTLSVLGWRVSQQIIFPLLFLFFAVPMGEELIPILIEFTADFTVAMIQLTGIPVYREGAFFQLPTGSWSVVKACSGVRYLIASITLGCLYAYISYRSKVKRTIFILVSIVIPIIANGLRAFMIVMIGHYSGMELATGVDHLVYGWLFFGLVIGLMFYIGSFWRDDDCEKLVSGKVEEEKNENVSETNNNLKKSVIFILFLMVIWPIISINSKDESNYDFSKNKLVPQLDNWRTVGNHITNWQPKYTNLSHREVVTFQKNSSKVQVFLGFYAAQKQDQELINYVNRLTGGDDTNWTVKDKSSLNISLTENSLKIPVSTLFSDNEQLRVAYVYYAGHQFVTGKLNTKWLEAKARLTGGLTSGTVIMAIVDLRENTGSADDLLKTFFEENAIQFKQSIELTQNSLVAQ